MTIAQYIKKLQNDPLFMDNVTSWQVVPARAAAYGEFPASLDRRVIDALRMRGIERPYIHQSRAMEAALSGRDFVVVTPTASGKTACVQGLAARDKKRIYLEVDLSAMIANVNDKDEMADTLLGACEIFWTNHELWTKLMLQAMATDFSWRRAANDYMDIYHGLHPEVIRYNKRRDR